MSLSSSALMWKGKQWVRFTLEGQTRRGGGEIGLSYPGPAAKLKGSGFSWIWPSNLLVNEVTTLFSC